MWSNDKYRYCYNLFISSYLDIQNMSRNHQYNCLVLLFEYLFCYTFKFNIFTFTFVETNHLCKSGLDWSLQWIINYSALHIYYKQEIYSYEFHINYWMQHYEELHDCSKQNDGAYITQLIFIVLFWLFCWCEGGGVGYHLVIQSGLVVLSCQIL